MPDEPTTQNLKIDQVRREAGERELAKDSPPGAAERAHRRRADKAAYLKEKLEERERAEREAGLE